MADPSLVTVTGLTADRMLAIESASVVSGEVNDDGDLILTTHGGTEINAGDVKGPVGPAGSPLPSGCLSMWAGDIASPPSGWLACDGSAVSRSTYSNLFAAIGTVYGTGDGSTTFNLPDLRGRFPMGTTDSDVAGETGGSTTITADNLPAHSHDAGSLSASSAGSHHHQVDGNWTLGLVSDVPSGGSHARFTNTADDNTRNVSNGGAHTHPVSGSTASTGSGQAYLPPYLAMNFIIKT